jgi:hypothetical protein
MPSSSEITDQRRYPIPGREMEFDRALSFYDMPAPLLNGHEMDL